MFDISSFTHFSVFPRETVFRDLDLTRKNQDDYFQVTFDHLLGGVHGRPPIFFPGEGKISQGGGKDILFAKKIPNKTLFSSRKFIKHNILVHQGWGERAPSCPPLQTPIVACTFKESGVAVITVTGIGNN